MSFTTIKKEQLSKTMEVDGGWLLDRVSGKVHLRGSLGRSEGGAGSVDRPGPQAPRAVVCLCGSQPGVILLTGGIWQSPEASLVVTTQEGGATGSW